MGVAHPHQPVAADLHGNVTYLLEQRLLLGRACDRAATTAERFVRAIQPPEVPLGPLLRRDIARRRKHTLHFALRVPVDGRVVEHLHQPTRDAAHDQGIVAHHTLGEDALIAFARLLRLGEVVAEVAADQFLTAAPRRGFSRGVDVGDLAVATDRHQRIQARFQQATRVTCGFARQLRAARPHPGLTLLQLPQPMRQEKERDRHGNDRDCRHDLDPEAAAISHGPMLAPGDRLRTYRVAA